MNVKKLYVTYSKNECTLVFNYGVCTEEGYPIDYYLRAGKKDFSNKCTEIIFDKSIKDFKPTSCANWFSDLPYLTQIFNLQYLNTLYVTDFSCMFKNCCSIAVLDIHTFLPKGSVSVTNMFEGCNTLAHLKCTNKFLVSSAKVPEDCKIYPYYDDFSDPLGKYKRL